MPLTRELQFDTGWLSFKIHVTVAVVLLFPRYSACFGHVYPRDVIAALTSLVPKDNFLYTTNLGVRSPTVCC